MHSQLLPPVLILAAALVAGGISLLQFEAATARKGALLAFWAASGLGAWGLTGSPWPGLATLLLWIAFPLSETVIVLRRLQIPRERHLENAVPPLEEFPDIRPLTHDVEALGFKKVDDCALTPTPQPQSQFFRLFGHEGGLHHAVLGHVSEGQFAFDFAAFTSEDKQGRLWITWDYPLSYGLKMPPHVVLHRTLDCGSIAELFASHRELLVINGVVDAELVSGSDLEAVRGRLERSLARQLQYNVSIGILSPDRATADGFRYSWRGTFYVAGEVVRDLVRL